MTKKMKVSSKINAIAGGMVFVSAILGFFVNKWWLLLAMFVGANLFQFAFSGFCPLEIMLKKLEK